MKPPLEDWGSSFWQETDYRIKEVTKTLEKDLRTELGGSFAYANAKAGIGETKTETERAEIVTRAQRVVNSVQISELSNIIDMLADVLDENSQRRYFILIDRLDENWIEDDLRYRLVKALIETIRDFRRIRQAKIVVAIRWDLLTRVYRETRDSGFQEEKYESLYLRIEWTKKDILTLVEKRINSLIRRKYTNSPIKYSEILPRKIGRERGADYFVDRTLLRPRDGISFFNHCISESVNKVTISQTALRSAEGLYSRSRIRALFDEWKADYDYLEFLVKILRSRHHQFLLNSVEKVDIDNFVLGLLANAKSNEKKDEIILFASKYFEENISFDRLISRYFSILYNVGVVGLKLEKTESYCWSMTGNRRVSVRVP